MKRRNFLALTSLGSLGLAIGSHRYLAYEYPLKYKTCPQFSRTETEPELRFVAVGDVGTGDQNQYAVAKSLNCYFNANPFTSVLLTGDNIYPYGEISRINAAFEQPYKELLQQQVKFYAAIGNHDILTNNGVDQINYPKFNMSGRYYTFIQKNVQFFVLDTNPEADWEKQLIWLEESLAKSNKPWKIVSGHHSIYSSGYHGSNLELIEYLTPIFARYGVQLYLNGHEHDYERTKPINGTTYLTCGAGGAKLRPVGKSDWTAYSVSQWCFAAFEVYPDSLVISGINTVGEIFDHTTINLSSLNSI
ncbi:putative purple acid phosphatase precursor [Chondrocystis sp. NIES-4102]|nr:putative purple acid phosphatase precursor [Chondrocystis sp. NIES-4102]